MESSRMRATSPRLCSGRSAAGGSGMSRTKTAMSGHRDGPAVYRINSVGRFQREPHDKGEDR